MMKTSSRIPRYGSVSVERLKVYIHHLHAASTVQSSTNLTLSHSDALIDEKVNVKVTGLAPGQRATLQASFTSNSKRFISCGHYEAGEDGSIDTFRDYSHGGSFTGVEPMGLFWSVQTPPDTTTGRTFRLMKDDVTTPYNVQVSVHNGYTHLDNLFSQLPESFTSLLASAQVLRRYMAHGVRRIPVQDGKIRGFLFLPPGSGPFPGLVDLFGMIGGVPEYRAALLASHGYAALALAYVNYDDLPASPSDIQPEYFLNAAEWMSCHPAVKTGGIAMVGVCAGAGFCLYTGAFSPHVKAVVSVNGPPFLTAVADHKIDGHDISSVKFDQALAANTDKEAKWRNSFPLIEDKLIPVQLPYLNEIK